MQQIQNKQKFKKRVKKKIHLLFCQKNLDKVCMKLGWMYVNWSDFALLDSLRVSFWNGLFSNILHIITHNFYLSAFLVEKILSNKINFKPPFVWTLHIFESKHWILTPFLLFFWYWIQWICEITELSFPPTC